MIKILLAHEIAKTCFLIQALLYRAVARLPLQIPEDEAIDPVLTPEECRVAGLQPDPKWEEIEKGEDDERVLAVIALPAGSDERKRLHEQRIKWKAVQEWRRTEWNHGFQELLKRHHNEFLMALVEGRLRCHGQRSGLLTKEDIAAGASWQDIPWEEIPSTFWSSCEIDWEKNRAKGGTAAYDSIIVETEDLFREFPFPRPEETVVGRIGDCFILTDEIAAPTRNLGRPPFPWDEFHLELARRVVRHELPKQDSVLKAMQDWCESQWGKSPGDSTLKQKLKPYYDEFVWPEKVRK
jgi:hypothetical protein